MRAHSNLASRRTVARKPIFRGSSHRTPGKWIAGLPLPVHAGGLCKCSPRIHSPGGAGFTLLEVLISLVVLTFGLLSLLAILQKTLAATEPVEFETRAVLLAQSVLEGIRSDPGGFPFIPGVNPGTWPVVEKNLFATQGESLLADENGDPFDMANQSTDGPLATMSLPFVFSIPGNGIDDDSLLPDEERWVDDGRLGGIPFNGVDDLTEDFFMNRFNTTLGSLSKRDLDGGIEEDVNERILRRGALFDDEDSDGDGIFNDSGDYQAPAVNFSQLYGIPEPNPYKPDGDFSYDPQRHIDEEFSNGRDDDGDGYFDEDLTLASQFRQIVPEENGLDRTRNPYNYFPTLPGNGLDDDGDGLTDEEVYDGLDNDDDKQVDEDCKAALMPFQPFPFPPPNDEYSFQIAVRRLAVGGDGIDNDGDGLIDEEFFNGLDEPFVPAPFATNLRLVADEDEFIDEDVAVYPAPGVLLVTVFIYQGDDRQDNDGDGWIDEEELDGIDNDNDGETDEDFYRRVFRTTGLVRLRQ